MEDSGAECRSPFPCNKGQTSPLRIWSRNLWGDFFGHTASNRQWRKWVFHTENSPLFQADVLT